MLCSTSPRKFLGAVLGSALFITTASGQNAPAPAPQAPAAPSPGVNPGRGTPSSPTDPGQMPGRGQTMPGSQDRIGMQEMPRTFFFSGKVMLDDGTPPPDPVVIERVCNGIAKPEAYTDTKGRFNFQLGQNNAMMADASTSANDGIFGNPGSSMSDRNAGPGMMGSRGITERDLMGCELRASLPGFRSDVYSLAGRRSLDNPDVGTIGLHRMAKVDGFTFSGTSAFAPKDARKAYEKGRDLNKKNKLEAAEKELNKAVTEYPKYAAAWYELGVVYHQQKKLAEAQKAYESAVQADGKFISPYGQLARLSASQQKWEDTANYSARAIKLNPFFSPDLYFLNGVANLNLNKVNEAEESAREALKMDVGGKKNPQSMALLGVILAQKQDYQGAAQHLKAYLKAAPNAGDAERVKAQLEQIEKVMAGREANKEGQSQ